MYVTIEEIADYLSMSEKTIHSLINKGRIRVVHDGKQYLINKDQFTTHLEQVEKYKQKVKDYLSESISHRS